MTRGIDTADPPQKGPAAPETDGKGPLDDLVSALSRAVDRKRTNGTEDKDDRT